jgi:NIPSNAP
MTFGKMFGVSFARSTRLTLRRAEDTLPTHDAGFLTHPNFAHLHEEKIMAIYELRTYTLYVGKMAEAVKLYTEIGFPALKKGGFDKNLVGYFQGDTGTINQLLHLWKFSDDAARRAHWATLSANSDFMEGFAAKFRPLVMTQEVKLLTAAPWGPHP